VFRHDDGEDRDEDDACTVKVKHCHGSESVWIDALLVATTPEMFSASQFGLAFVLVPEAVET